MGASFFARSAAFSLQRSDNRVKIKGTHFKPFLRRIIPMDTLHLPFPKPKMVAHRGVSGLEMENTCSAFVAAGNRSYWGIETDVHVTGDGNFILIHDDDTRKVALDSMIVEKTTYETLRSLRLRDRDGKRGRKDLILPSLREYIQICKKYEKISVLELKNSMEPSYISRIISIIREEGWLEGTVFISFALENLLALRKALPAQKAQYLIEKTPDWAELLRILKDNALDLDADYRLLTEDRVRQLHAAGIQVNVWTVDSLEDARRLADWGVDYITTNIIE